MEENQTTYRIRTKLGETEPINIPITLMQEYNSFELLSLKINMDDTYHSYTSTEGIVIGRVSTANNGLGIPNVRVSIFVPKGAYNQSDEEEVLYPFSSPIDKDGDKVRYNLLPSESDVDCYQVVGTLPTKRRILDNETVCDVFEKYYKYTTVTNEAGDFMLSNIPVGKQRIHIDADLSDIGPFLSQKPYDMIENLGFDKNKFDSTRQFKTSKDLDSLAQVISQTKSVYVYPYWGDSTEYGSDIKITRTDLSLNYEFKTNAIFIGSVITDKQSNAIRHNCTATESAGKMSDMVTGPGRIEMIRKTIDNKIEQYRIKGDMLINDNGVWCYMVPMNLDYVRTDEYGNIIPTDDPNKGVPTRARVRFRITLNQMDSDEDAYKRCSYLVPNNPRTSDEKFLKENDADYSFGSDTWDESFVDLFWNKVYTVKSYVPRIQKTTRPTNRKHTGIKMVNHYGDNNPFPYNGLSIKLSFMYRLICVIIKIIIDVIKGVNMMLSIIGGLPCYLVTIKVWPIKWIFRPLKKYIPTCIPLSAEFCDDGINKNEVYPGCLDCVWKLTREKCQKSQYNEAKNGGESAVCTTDTEQLITCVENQLAQQNDATSFNFSNDWINGCLYMPLWYRHIRPKKSFFFGLFKRSARDQWCSSNNTFPDLKLATFCSHRNSQTVKGSNYKGESVTYNIVRKNDSCGESCHSVRNTIGLQNGIIVNRENIYGQKVWYYKSVEVSSPKNNLAPEYLNYNKQPMVAKTLYATDIVLLGSMNNCDLNGIPKFYNYLKGSTYNMPTDILFSDTEIDYSFDDKGELVTQKSYKTSVASGCDWGNKNEYGYYDGGLFYSIGCSSIKVDTPSCINLRRICELGVGQDEMQYIENINVSINSENDKLDLNNSDNQLRPDGFISYDDIIDFDYRSMFATMNGNRLKTKINTENGVREYDLKHLYIDNFDGSLKELMASEQKDRGRANYRYNYNLESTCNDYLTFRYGDNPYFYDGKSKVDGSPFVGNFTLPKYENSFYFYFGLKEGKTAIDLFNEQYNGPCSTKSEEEESIDYTKKPNGWCFIDSDDDYSHKKYDGYLTFNLEGLQLPCRIIFNSKDNSSVTYTVVKMDLSDDKANITEDTGITDEKICFYGDLDKEFMNSVNGYSRYGLLYGNSIFGEDTKICYMLNNGDYNVFITDGEGNQHSYSISINGSYLEFDDAESPFRQPNNVLLKYYKTANGKYSNSPYNSVSKSPSKDEIKVEIGNDGIPSVSRLDKEMKNVVNSNVISEKYLKLNGTICIYNVYYENTELKNFIIEVEPYDKDTDGNYVDEDFWNGEEEKTKTWYSPKMAMIDSENAYYADAVINMVNGKEFVNYNKNKPSDYFYFVEQKYGDDKNNTKLRCYIVKCPKGDVNYRVRVTQLCKDDNGRWFKSNNYSEKKITINQPTPYKLYINDVDYDIIKNFNTGYVLRTDRGLQTMTEGNPFNDFGTSADKSNFSKIKGWLNISDINNGAYDWEENEELYGKNTKKFELDEKTGNYKLNNALSIKESFEPLEPQPSQYGSDEEYNNAYSEWVRIYDEWQNGWYYNYDKNGNQIDNTEISDSDKKNWANISSDKYLGGPCGYKFVSEESAILNNRLNFVDTVKSAFWLECENSDKTITYSVRTDDTPYNIWSVYNEEEVSKVDDDYNEAKSDKSKRDSRIAWQCVGESVTSIGGIKIPTITAYDSASFGIENDNKRQRMTETYSADKKTCFGQDNIAENSEENGGISIKPPYLVACVNNEGITKPDNLKKGLFFDSTTNSAGLQTYEFGKGNGKLRDGDYQFFGFHIIDKIFSANIVCWAYMNEIPYYVPYMDYDASDTTFRLGNVIKMDGILSGNINNGISSSKDDGGYVDDFDEMTIFNMDVPIKTYDGDTEDSIPTRRAILFSKETPKEDDLRYKNYRYTTKVSDENQYRSVMNSQGELLFTDKDNNCNLTRDLYGSMKVKVLSTTINEVFGRNNSISSLFNPTTSESGDTSLTLKVNCSNSDTDKAITYYIFRASQQKSILSDANHSPKKDKICWYPLNMIAYNEEKSVYSLDCKCNTGNEDSWVWDGTTATSQYIFNRNTSEKYFKDKTTDRRVDTDLADYDALSGISYTDENGEEKINETHGYGETGVFKNLKHMPYFVVAVTENNCRAISPVYDFHVVYYIAGIIDNGDKQKILRTGLVYVLRDVNCKDNAKADNDVNYGYSDRFNGYCKIPRNYYLTQYDFTASYSFTNGNTIISNDEIAYHKEIRTFVSSESDVKLPNNIGKSWVKKENSQYTLYTNVGGTIIEGNESTTKPEGNLLGVGNYFYCVYLNEYDKDNVQKKEYQLIRITSDGYTEYVDIVDEVPSDYKELTLDAKYYLSYTRDNTTYYKGVTYSMCTLDILGYDPKIPYFMRYDEKILTDDEYNSLKDTFNNRLLVDKTFKYYVTDITGLRHKCKLYDVCNSAKDWEKYMKAPN